MIDPEDILKGIWSFIKMLIWHFLFNIVFFYVGFIVLKVFTLWKYPPNEMTEKDENIAMCTGAITPLLVLGCLCVFNNYIS